jgi:hypothetical protein
VTELAEQLRRFEPLLDELAAVFCPEAGAPIESHEDPVFGAYHRCEVKRSRIGKALASHHRAVKDHADEIMRAIAHDHCPSGNRQLIEPLVDVLGARQTMERILDYLETGSAVERLGAAQSWYWAAPALQYSTLNEHKEDSERFQSGVVRVALTPGMATPATTNADAHLLMRELGPRFRIGCLRAFLATDDPIDRRYFSHHFSLIHGHYPEELHGEVEAVRRLAKLHPEQFAQDCHGD